jgi:16S rRNA (uracil1498-N3)-methyltransferase
MTRIILQHPVDAPSQISLSGDEHHYLTRVRRHSVGDRVELRDAEGRCFVASITTLSKGSASLAVERRIDDVRLIYPVTLAVAVPKRNRMDDVVRKLSEVGVEKLIPLVCKRSVVLPKIEKVDRWRRIAAEAMRQCGREVPLVIDPPITIGEVLTGTGEAETRLILHPEKQAPGFSSLDPGADLTPPVVILIGPEGGFTGDEVRDAVAAGFDAVRLPMPILRIETAAIACAVLAVAALGRDSAPH